MSNLYTIEVTDTFGGESNYTWVRRYLVLSKSERGAITKLARHEGSGWRFDGGRYNLSGACICAFVDWVSSAEAEDFCKRHPVEMVGFKNV